MKTNEERQNRYHAPVWDEQLVMEMGGPGRRGFLAPPLEPGIAEETGSVLANIPEGMAREEAPALPELSEFEAQRHFLHLSQQTLGMVGVSLFGTCTMKYNPRLGEVLAARPEMSEMHPRQDESTLQGTMELIYGLDRMLCELSGMDQFVFQAGGGAGAAYVNVCTMRAYLASRGELEQRNQVITTIQSHPCNPATAATAGFDVITLTLEENGYPSVEQLKAAVSDRTAALMINNPDDMGIYNPHVKEWVDIVHEAGGLCFYDHANFNGVMSKVRARELGFDACMYMLHKSFGAPKGGGGPAVGAYGASEKLVPFMPRPFVKKVGDGYELEQDVSTSTGRVREFWGNVPQVVKGYGWTRAMGGDGIENAADLSVLFNNYMEKRMLEIPGVSISNPEVKMRRLEMTRYSLEELTEQTGVTVIDISNRMLDFGLDAPWLSHEPWIVPEPITPEAGEAWSLEEVDYWLDGFARACQEAHDDPEMVKSAPHKQAIHQLQASRIGDPDYWATTYRAYVRKHGGRRPADQVAASA